jgi:hypothetical protein
MGTLNRLAAGASRRAWKEYADVRRRLTRAGSARETLARLPRSRRDVARWTEAVADQHLAYRESLTAPDGDVAIVCVSNRPELIEAIAANVDRQRRRPDVVVCVLNVDDPPLDRFEARLSASDREVIVLHRPSERSLGDCLNAAMAATDARFIAKFDDDDHYGAMYLVDMLGAHGYAGAGIVG